MTSYYDAPSARIIRPYGPRSDSGEDKDIISFMGTLTTAEALRQWVMSPT